MDARKLVSVTALVLAALAAEAAILNHFVAAPLVEAVAAARLHAASPPAGARAVDVGEAARPEFTEEILVVAPRDGVAADQGPERAGEGAQSERTELAKAR